MHIASTIVPFSFGSGIAAFIKLPNCPEHPCECVCNFGAFADGFGWYSILTAFVVGVTVTKFGPSICGAVRRYFSRGEEAEHLDFASVAREKAAKARR